MLCITELDSEGVTVTSGVLKLKIPIRLMRSDLRSLLIDVPEHHMDKTDTQLGSREYSVELSEVHKNRVRTRFSRQLTQFEFPSGSRELELLENNADIVVRGGSIDLLLKNELGAKKLITVKETELVHFVDDCLHPSCTPVINTKTVMECMERVHNAPSDYLYRWALVNNNIPSPRY